MFDTASLVKRLQLIASFAISRVKGRTNPAPLNCCFYIPGESRGWILDRIIKELSKRCPCPFSIVHNHRSLPESSHYFFPHYTYYLDALRWNPQIWNSKSAILITHENEAFTELTHQLKYCANHCQDLVDFCCMNSRIKGELMSFGIPATNLHLLVGATDTNKFKPHQRSNGNVCISSAYYSRKQPELLKEVVKENPQRKFCLLGRNWEKWDGFTEMLKLDNFQYLQIEYKDYPKAYKNMDIFLSTSLLEGGPISLLEAMSCNLIPVVSNTGFASDIIQHNVNGLLFEPDASSKHVSNLIDIASHISTDISSSVTQYSWDHYASRVWRIMNIAN